MSAGTLVAWKVAEGQAVGPGDELAEVETDKATMGWESQEDGVIARLLVPSGAANIEVGTPVAIMVDEADQVAAFKDYEAPVAGGASGSASASASAAAPAAPAPAGAAGRSAGPAARLMMQRAGLALADVPATGPRGVVTKGDVLAALAAGAGSSGGGGASSTAAAAPAAPAAAAAPPKQQQQQQQQPKAPLLPAPRGGHTDEPTTGMRRVIAARLAESKASIPHVYFSADVEVDGLAAVRAAVLARSGAKVSVNDCVVRAAALALAEVPAANAFWDAAAGAAAPSAGVDIAIAVATPGGLITPIVRGADAKGLAAIGAEVRELAGRARAGRLRPEEFQGGSFSISNLGMFGVDAFQAIVNPPQACILAVGGARATARPGGPGGAPRAAQLVTLTLSADARVYDADVAAALLAALRRNLEEPARLLV